MLVDVRIGIEEAEEEKPTSLLFIRYHAVIADAITHRGEDG